MNSLPLLTLFCTLISIVFSVSVQAQTMYRCGSAYQDRPCENGQQGKVIGVNRAPVSSDKPALDLSCSRRGEEAKKIIWSREGGASADKLMAEANSGERRKLIADVYAIRGNSGDVRAMIESDCMAEKVRARQGGYMPDEEASSPASSRAAERKTQTQGDADKRVENTDNAAARKRAQCDNLKKLVANNRSEQRTGGNSGTMNSLNQQKNDLEEVLKSAGCDSVQGTMQMQ
jgi:hypothetical protein